MREANASPLTHDKVDSASGVAGTRDPPLETIENDVVTFLADRQLDVGSIGRSDESLGHCESRSSLSGEEVGEPLFLLRLVTVAGKDFHVAGVAATKLRLGSAAVANAWESWLTEQSSCKPLVQHDYDP